MTPNASTQILLTLLHITPYLFTLLHTYTLEDYGMYHESISLVILFCTEVIISRL